MCTHQVSPLDQWRISGANATDRDLGRNNIDNRGRSFGSSFFLISPLISTDESRLALIHVWSSKAKKDPLYLKVPNDRLQQFKSRDALVLFLFLIPRPNVSSEYPCRVLACNSKISMLNHDLIWS